MPVFPPGAWINPDSRPAWCEVTGPGGSPCPVDGGRFERHHHDDHEIWFISEGKANVLADGAEHYVQAGDIVLTQAGDTHDVVEVYEDLRGFFVETGLSRGWPGRAPVRDPTPTLADTTCRRSPCRPTSRCADRARRGHRQLRQAGRGHRGPAAGRRSRGGRLRPRRYGPGPGSRGST